MLKSLQYKTLILICIGMLGFTGCKSDSQRTQEHLAEVISESERYSQRVQRSTNMLVLSNAARSEQNVRCDKDPKVAAKRRAFLECVVKTAWSYGESLHDQDPHRINAHYSASFDQLVELDHRYVFDQGFEAAKLGAGDEELGKMFKEAVMRELKVQNQKSLDKKNEEEARKKAREGWK